MKILLVDDEMEYISTQAERLSFRGIEAHWVTSGKEALEKLTTETYSLAVMDLKMPGIGGIELKKMVEKKYPHMKFIYVTGHGSEDDYNECTADSSICYMVKPINIDNLVKIINNIL
ncbi:MAG: response regulator [Desulfobacteraceae bacterium 4572_19]|nr:MAG: response regulator [Desulfobacteraceae bacterium 4572_19]